jgi:hypothetical protein
MSIVNYGPLPGTVTHRFPDEAVASMVHRKEMALIVAEDPRFIQEIFDGDDVPYLKQLCEFRHMDARTARVTALRLALSVADEIAISGVTIGGAHLLLKATAKIGNNDFKSTATKLSITKSNLTQAHVNFVCTRFAHLKSLRLNGGNTASGPEGATALFAEEHGILKFSNLTALDLSDNGFGPAGAEILFPKEGHGISGFENLQELRLGGNAFGEIGAGHLFNDETGIHGIQTLTTLDLRNNEFDETATDALFDDDVGIYSMQNLTTLHLGGNTFGEVSSNVSQKLEDGGGIAQLSKLVELDLEGTEIDEEWASYPLFDDYNNRSGVVGLVGRTQGSD